MLSGLPTGFTARAEEETDCCRIPADVARATARPARGAALSSRARCWTAGAWRPDDASRRDRPGRPARRRARAHARWSSARRDTTIREAAQRMSDGRARRASSSTAAASARDPHRPRPAHARRRRRACPPTTPVSAAMTAPAVHGVGRPHRARGAAGHARPRHPPPARRLGDRPRSSASSRTPTSSAAEARTPFHLRAAIARAPTTSTRSSQAAREPAPDDRRAAPRARRRRCTSPASTRWSSTRSPAADRPRRRRGRRARRSPFAWLALGSVARREATPGLRRRERDRPGSGDAHGDERSSSTRCAISRRVEAGPARVRPAPDEKGTTAANPLLVRSLASWQRAAQQLARGPHAGAGADPRLGRRRQPHGVGDPHRGVASPRPSAPRAATRRCCASWRASRSPTARPPASCAGSSSSTPASTAAGWTSSTAASSHRRPRPLGGDGRRGDERLDARAPARRGRGRHAVGGRRRHAGRRLPARDGPAPRAPGRAARGRARSPTTTSIPPRSARSRARYLKEAFRAVASVQKGVRRAQPGCGDGVVV